jgi:PAS domain S-box-containing protein
MRALLVVHDPCCRTALEDVLARRGWHVGQLSSAAELLRHGSLLPPPELVLVQADGTGEDDEICGAVRVLGGTDRYLMALTGTGDPARVQELCEAGVDDILGIPVVPAEAELRLQLAEARLARRRAGHPHEQLGSSVPIDPIEARFRVQQAFLEGLFESAPEGVVVLDAQDRVVRINGEFSKVFGFTPDEARGRSINDLIVPDELRSEGSELDGDIRRGERVMVETVRRHRDGRLIDVSVLATPIVDNGPVGTLSIYRDITEKKLQEAALRDSEARYRALFDQSPVGVFLCGRDLRITHCNEYLTRVVGASYEQIVGADLISLRDHRLLSGLRAALEGEPAFYDGPFRTRTGKQLHVSVQYAPLRDDRGEVVGGIGVLEDITQRVEAEMKLRVQAAEMERVNLALRERGVELEAAMRGRSRLYTAMNHELRTPISSIMLYQELLMSGALGPLLDDQMAALQHSHTATRHLLDLVRDILDLSKIEAGKMSLQADEVCVGTLLREIQASVASLTERYGSPLRLEMEPGVGSIVTDPQRLRQILLNFVSNAAKYGRQNPIDLRCRRSPAGEVVLEVVDRGIGIAKHDLSHIFEDFVQLGSAPEEGTGLGLAISKRLTELLGGQLEVESDLGVGSTFRLIIPDRPAVAVPLELS